MLWTLLLGLAVLLVVLIVRNDAGTVLGMDIGAFGQLGVLFALLAFISIGVFRGMRTSEFFKNALIWTGIALALVTVYAYRFELESVATRVTGELVPGVALTSSDGNSITVNRGRSGHFSVKAEIGGVPVDMLVDTGASTVVLNYTDAENVGIDVNSLNFSTPVGTANGNAFFARIVLDTVTVGGIELNNVRAAIAQPGKLQQSVLGNSFLNRLSSYEFSGSKLVLRR
uniref:retropepsin-like aspartic protease family protein n=1 Tax=Pararhizobium sp. IMCC3301 TaxID=3067904 RepID=UPI0027420879|nr:TIGR02281 family clan AA aspartic protease [Pararhizobium sp. IMCC3301]